MERALELCDLALACPSHCASRRETVVPRSNVPSRSNTTTGKRLTISCCS